MVSKVLSHKSCKRFYKLRDALGDFAYEKLDIAGELYVGGKGKKFGSDNIYNETILAETMDSIWDSPLILKEFIDKNPAHLDFTDLAVIRNWRSSLSGVFIIFRHEGRIVFLRGNALFEVSGLWEDIENVLGVSDFPIIVETTLLPFEGRIVYHGFMSHMPLSMGQGMRSMLDSEIDEALQNPLTIRGSDDFIEIVPKIKEKEAKEMLKRMEHEAELEEEGRKQMEGFHRGILAGLTEQEREAAIDAEIKEDITDSTHNSLIDILKSGLTKGSVTRDLEELISKEPKRLIQRWALILGVEATDKGRKADLIQAVLPVLRTNPFLPELVLRGGLNLRQFDAYHRLYESGGVLEVAEKDINSLADLPSTARLMCYSFYTRGTSTDNGRFTFVIPEDIMGILDDFDWDDIRENIVVTKAAADIADAVIELRGVANINEIHDEFCRFYPEAFSQTEYKSALATEIMDGRMGGVWLEADDGEDYLLDYEIAAYYRMVTNPEDEPYEKDADGYSDDPVISGSLQPLEFILEQRKDKKARPLEENMLSADAVYDWKCARPAVRAMRDYLDEHVPDSQNDYYYADNVIEELMDYMMFGTMNGSGTVNDWLAILEDYDYAPTEAHLNRVLALLMNMHNALPSWMNNGWAPNELADIKLGRKSFYDENGSRIKVGRNDPCPCGSGKKYKNCCGKI